MDDQWQEHDYTGIILVDEGGNKWRELVFNDEVFYERITQSDMWYNA